MANVVAADVMLLMSSLLQLGQASPYEEGAQEDAMPV
jgi:hypothetical protein